MTDAERKFREDRALRNAARSLVSAQLAQVRRDLAERGIGQRIADRATEKAKAAADHGVEVASYNRGIVAATIAALVLWLARNPLLAGGRFLWDRVRPGGSTEVEASPPEPAAGPEPGRRGRRSGGNRFKERDSD